MQRCILDPDEWPVACINALVPALLLSSLPRVIASKVVQVVSLRSPYSFLSQSSH